MNRRIMLMLGTLAAILLAFLLANLLTVGPSGTHRPRPDLTRRPPPSAPSSEPAQGLATSGTRLRLTDRDRLTGRLTAIYEADSFVRSPDGQYLVQNPCAEFYAADGRQTTVRAPRGTVYAVEFGGKPRVERGTLEGGVEVVFDRSTDPHRRPASERPADIVRIVMDDVSFDRDRMELSTPNRVEVTSAEVDLSGRDLLLQWSRAPDEIRLLRIEDARRMVVKEDAQRAGNVSLLGGRSATAASMPAGGPATAPAPREPMPPLPTDRDAVLATFDLVPTEATTAASGPASRPAGRNVFLVDIVSQGELANVQSASGSIRGAEKLSLTIEWERTKDKSAKARASQPSAPPPEKSATTAAREPTVITWRGPLVLQPVGRVSTVQRRYVVAGIGPRMTLQDAQATAVCDSFIYFYPQQTGQLSGMDGKARVTLADGQTVESDLIRYDGQRGLADLLGAGRMSQPSGKTFAMGRGTTQAASAPASAAAPDEITWTEKVLADLDRFTGPDASGQARQRQYVRLARFSGQVQLSQGATGDRMRCSHSLDVTLAPVATPTGSAMRVRAAPVLAVAVGDVSASQQGADITAQQVTVEFDQGQPAYSVAQGQVVVVDRRQADVLEARADMIRSDLRQRNAVLTGKGADGKPGASVVRGADRLEGDEIRLYESAESAFVEGPGLLSFMTDRDLDGRLTAPRPVAITWSKSMRYVGERDNVDFAGNVFLRTQTETMQCQHMEVKLSRPLPTSAPAPAAGPASPEEIAAALGNPMGTKAAPSAPAPAQKAAKPPKRPTSGPAIALNSYSGRQITEVHAEKGVLLQTVRRDDQQNLVQRMTLSGQELTYSPTLRTATIPGHGRLLSEDYRPPRPARATGDSSPTSIESPSQTVFEWSDAMHLAQEQRWVMMEGEVGMVHVSGQQMQPPEGEAMPQWDKLTAGRRMGLTCGKLEATFEPPAPKASPAAASGPASAPAVGGELPELAMVGPIQRFLATGQVNFKDGPSEIQAERLQYDRAKDLLVVYGYLEGQPKARAVVSYEDLKTHTMRSVTSPDMVCYMKDGKIARVDASKVVGGGSK